MAERHRTFTVARPADEPVTFDIAYERKDADGNWVEETQSFGCPSRVPGGIIADMFARGGGISAMVLFLQEVIVPEDRDRFVALVHDHDVAVPAAVMTEITNWLVEEYGNRPTKRRASSAGGSPTNGRGAQGKRKPRT